MHLDRLRTADRVEKRLNRPLESLLNNSVRAHLDCQVVWDIREDETILAEIAITDNDPEVIVRRLTPPTDAA
jgi:hypothetical protein